MSGPSAAAPSSGDGLILHASCVALDGRGLLIMGPSGAGKSALALQLMALGARLVSDDRTEVTAGPRGLLARCPSPAIRGLIEARGVGLLRAEPAQDEDHRLPPRRSMAILGSHLPLVLRVRDDHFPAALLLYLEGGRQD